MVHIIVTAKTQKGIAAIKQHAIDTEKLGGDAQRQMKAILSKHEVAPNYTSVLMIPNLKIKTVLWAVVQGKMRKRDDLRAEWEKKFEEIMAENGASKDIDYTLEVEL